MDDGRIVPESNASLCVVIAASSSSSSSSIPPPPPPPTIRHNENSARAYAKRFRVYAFREFLLRTYFRRAYGERECENDNDNDNDNDDEDGEEDDARCYASSSSSSSSSSVVVLDVAGGNGHLSWIFRNADGMNSIVVDPVMPKHDRLIKSLHFLLDHPEEMALRSVVGLPTHQPLARLVPRILANCRRGLPSDDGSDVDNDDDDDDDGRGRRCRRRHRRPRTTIPSYMRMRVDAKLVDALRGVIVVDESPLREGGDESDDRDDRDDDALSSWDAYWESASFACDATGGAGRDRPGEGDATTSSSKRSATSAISSSSSSSSSSSYDDARIKDSRRALRVFRSLDLIVGFHP